VGIPSLHIIRANNGEEYRFYELSADLPDTLHFRDYESTVKVEDNKKQQSRIRIKEKVQIKVADEAPVLKIAKEAPPVLKVRSGHIRLRD
jgi:hypothetical protein